MAREIEAADCGLLSADLAAGIGRVKNGNGSLDLYILNENPWPQGQVIRGCAGVAARSTAKNVAHL